MAKGMACVALLIAACAPATPAAAQTEGRWKPLENNPACSVWQANPQPGDSATWSGTCTAGKAEGQGTLVWRYRRNGEPRGSRYVGAMRGGKFNGRGVITFASGARYEGEFRDGKFDGRGIFTGPGGVRYEGEFRDDKRHGRGIYTFAGGRYEGAYANDRAHGFGTFTTAAGEVYSGNWSNGCFKEGDRRAALGASREECGF